MSRTVYFGVLSAVYTIDNEGLEQYCAVVRFTGKFINHTCFKIPPDSQLVDSAMQEIRGVLREETRTRFS